MINKTYENLEIQCKKGSAKPSISSKGILTVYGDSYEGRGSYQKNEIMVEKDYVLILTKNNNGTKEYFFFFDNGVWKRKNLNFKVAEKVAKEYYESSKRLHTIGVVFGRTKKAKEELIQFKKMYEERFGAIEVDTEFAFRKFNVEEEFVYKGGKIEVIFQFPLIGMDAFIEFIQQCKNQNVIQELEEKLNEMKVFALFKPVSMSIDVSNLYKNKK